MEQDKGASADADRAVVNGAASVSAVPASIPSAGIEQVIERAEMALQAFENFRSARAAMNAARPEVGATPAEYALYDERYRYDHECERAHWTHALHMVVSGDLRALVNFAAQGMEAEGGDAKQAPGDSLTARSPNGDAPTL